MDRIKRLQPEDRDQLVAYLDGELPAEQTRSIDQTLSSNHVARHEVEMLTRTWEMLDLLPQEKASENFSQTTMQTVRLEDKSEPRVTAEQVIPHIRFGLGAIVWLGGMIAASWIGFKLTQSWTPNPADELIENLPVIQNLSLYQKLEVEDASENVEIDFLRELQRRKMLDGQQ